MEAKIMGILTTDMKRLVSEQQLGFIAAVCPKTARPIFGLAALRSPGGAYVGPSFKR